MARIKKVNVISLALFQAVLLLPIGLLAGVAYSVGGLFYDWYTTGGLNYGTALAFVALPIMPIYFGVAGFVLGLVEGLCYNLCTKWYKGMNLKFKED